MIIAIRRDPTRHLLFGVFLFVLPLVPAFVFPALDPADYAHDRYLYLPCLGFALVVAIGLRTLGKKMANRFSFRHAGWVFTIAVVIALSVATSAQMIYWANDLLLFDRATRIAPANLLAFGGLGKALVVRGRRNEAGFVFQQILKADPNDWGALYNLGLYECQNGNYRESEQYLSRAANVNIVDSDTLALLAEDRNHLGEFAQAEMAIRRALELRPNKPGYRRVLAESLAGEGKIEHAMEAARAELQAHPDDEDSKALFERLEEQTMRKTSHHR
jgi:tetratricopeptide (TPR) repeat protein